MLMLKRVGRNAAKCRTWRTKPQWNWRICTNALETKEHNNRHHTHGQVKRYRLPGRGVAKGGVQTPPKFLSFAKAKPNSQFHGIYMCNNLIRIRVSFNCNGPGIRWWNVALIPEGNEETLSLFPTVNLCPSSYRIINEHRVQWKGKVMKCQIRWRDIVWIARINNPKDLRKSVWTSPKESIGEHYE
jgi:hypothetical protein